jgi:hypothetical protein
MNKAEEAIFISEMWKANAERNAENELSLESSPMNIFVSEGTRIVYTGKNGRDYDHKDAKIALTIGGTYTVDHIDVFDWYSRVFLKEVPEKAFNTVIFREV